MRGIAAVLAAGGARAALAGALFSGAAAAADHPPPVGKAPPPVAAVPSWTGFYVGVGIGARSSETDATVTRHEFPAGFNGLDFCPNFAPGCVLSEPLNSTAFRFSPYVGLNWQFAPRWVVGIEGDYGFASRTTTLNGMVYPARFAMTGQANETFGVKTRWDAGVRARLGFLFNPATLVYATGGAAWLDVESSSVCSPLIFQTCEDGGPLVIKNSAVASGWTAGGGIEAMIARNWLVRGEYRYADFGTVSFTDRRSRQGDTETVSYNLNLKTHTATLGLAYKVGGHAAPSAAMAYASAAPAASSWGGFYIGVGGGTRSTETDSSVNSFASTNAGNLLAVFCPVTNANGGCANAQALNDTGFRISPYAGFNWQVAPVWVVGVEGDWGYADSTVRLHGMNYPLSGQNAALVGASESFSVRTKWDASVRARAGLLATPTLLLYATGGAAWLAIESTSRCSAFFLSICAANFTGGPFDITNAKTQLGWTAGGGLETKLWSNWIARAEYRYADFGTINNYDVRGTTNRLAVAYNVHVKSHTTNVGIGYKF